MAEPNAFHWLAHGGGTHTGNVRKVNEDSLLSLPAQGLFSVADGVGGGDEGRFASTSVMESLNEAFAGYTGVTEAGSFQQRCERVHRAVNEASNRLWEHTQATDARYCATTFLAMVCDPDRPEHACLLHAGDSRAYRLRAGKLEQLTRDHSPAGQWTPQQLTRLAREHHGKITRAVGIAPMVLLHDTHIELEHGDLILLCTDGLYNMVKDEPLTELLQRHRDAVNQEAAEVLIEAANQEGGRDNITAILVRYQATEPSLETGMGSDTVDEDPTESEATVEVPVKVPDPVEAPDIEKPILAQPQPRVMKPSRLAVIALSLLGLSGLMLLQAPFQPLHAALHSRGSSGERAAAPMEIAHSGVRSPDEAPPSQGPLPAPEPVPED